MDRVSRRAPTAASRLLVLSVWEGGAVDRTETPFAKACSYLNFNSRAKWTAHVAAGGIGVVTVALLLVLWLFADLMVWRGRVPDAGDLSPLQRAWLERHWGGEDNAD